MFLILQFECSVQIYDYFIVHFCHNGFAILLCLSVQKIGRILNEPFHSKRFDKLV